MWKSSNWFKIWQDWHTNTRIRAQGCLVGLASFFNKRNEASSRYLPKIFVAEFSSWKRTHRLKVNLESNKISCPSSGRPWLVSCMTESQGMLLSVNMLLRCKLIYKIRLCNWSCNCMSDSHPEDPVNSHIISWQANWHTRNIFSWMSLYRFFPSKHGFQPLRYATDLTSKHYISSERFIGPCLENPMNTRNIQCSTLLDGKQRRKWICSFCLLYSIPLSQPRETWKFSCLNLHFCS